MLYALNNREYMAIEIIYFEDIQRRLDLQNGKNSQNDRQTKT